MPCPRPNAPSEEVVGPLLAPAEAPSEELLAVLLPVVEYGSEGSLSAIPRTLLHVALDTSLITRASGWRPLVGVLIVGRFTWALAAYALHCGRLEPLSAAWRALPPPRDAGRAIAALLANPYLRHPEFYGGDARKAYDDYYAWLSGSELIRSRYGLFAADLEPIFAEADFLLALRSAVTAAGIVSPGLTNATLARFRARLEDEATRRSLADLFGVASTDLPSTLAAAYRSLKKTRHEWDSPPDEFFAKNDE